MTTTNPAGRTALSLASTFGCELRAYADPEHEQRAGLTREDALEIIAIDPSLVYVSAAEVAAAVTDAQIEALRAEAAQHGDMSQVSLCEIALYGAGQARGIIGALDRTGARVECARVIAEARAQG